MHLSDKGVSDPLIRVRNLFNYCSEYYGKRELSDLLGAKKGFVTRTINRPGSAPFEELSTALEKMGLSPACMFNERRIDYQSVISKLAGNEDYIPEEYTSSARSKVKTFNFIADFVDSELLGHTSLRNMFQVGKEYLNDPNNPINIDLLVDSLAYVEEKYGLDYRGQLSRNIGLSASKIIKDTSVGDDLSTCKTTKELYEKFFNEHISFFESNFKYEITSIKDGQITIESRPSEEGGKPGSESLCSYKIGILSGLQSFISGNKSASIVKVESIYENGKSNKYLISVS
jgi:hypothetical protein